MIKLKLNNKSVLIEGADRGTIRKLDAITSYRVEGFQFSPAFRTKRWDGKEHLLRFSKVRGYHAPSGLAIDIARKLKELGKRYTVEFSTKVRSARIDFVWNGDIELRGYQNEAVEAILSKPVTGSGILKMPIRSGKTKTAASVIERLGVPTLFIVPSQMLLHQTHEALSECFPHENVGRLGDGHHETEVLTVATIQTLDRMRTNKKKDFKELAQLWDHVIFDECHHIRGSGEWHKVMAEMDARFKIGLSATAYLDNKAENERGIIWLKATCGPIRYDVSASRLVEEGWLLRQNVKMYRVCRPDLQAWGWSKELRDAAIIHNRYRNGMIVKWAQAAARADRRVIIVANRLEHINVLCERMDDAGLDFRPVTGSDNQAARESAVEGLVDGDYNVLIGTVLGEGIDIPSVDTVINAEGGKDIKTSVQRQRNLTMADGKKPALLVDFYDETNPYMEKHSKARLKVYQSEAAFNVEVVG
jgi:superfamily II DNA or RNA helicase